jgi:hypothetical protein
LASSLLLDLTGLGGPARSLSSRRHLSRDYVTTLFAYTRYDVPLVRRAEGLRQHTLTSTASFKLGCVHCLYKNVGLHEELCALVEATLVFITPYHYVCIIYGYRISNTNIIQIIFKEHDHLLQLRVNKNTFHLSQVRYSIQPNDEIFR